MKAIISEWKDYELIDFGQGIKFERWNQIKLSRPDPLAIGNIVKYDQLMKTNDIYYNDLSGKGNWVFKKDIKDSWHIKYKDLTFKISPTAHKHVGLFPEQASNWDFVKNKIEKSNGDIKVLNLFAYTGAASINAAKAGAAEVVHVDALRQVNEWAKENSILNNTQDKLIRYICDDVLTFLRREVKRGNKYQVIIMDPPSYGRAKKNKVWKFDDDIDELLSLTKQLLQDPLCLIISVYKTDFDKNMLMNLLNKYYPRKNLRTFDLFLPSTSNKLLKAGISGIYEL